MLTFFDNIIFMYGINFSLLCSNSNTQPSICLSSEFSTQEIQNLNSQISNFLNKNNLQNTEVDSNDQIIKIMYFITNLDADKTFNQDQYTELQNIINSSLLINDTKAINIFNQIIDYIFQIPSVNGNMYIYFFILNTIYSYFNNLSTSYPLFFQNYISNIIPKFQNLFVNNNQSLIENVMFSIFANFAPKYSVMYDLIFQNRQTIFTDNQYNYPFFVQLLINKLKACNQTTGVSLLKQEAIKALNIYQQQYQNSTDLHTNKFLDFISNVISWCGP